MLNSYHNRIDVIKESYCVYIPGNGVCVCVFVYVCTRVCLVMKEEVLNFYCARAGIIIFNNIFN